MRCQQADRRLNDYQWDHALINADCELRNHLDSCVICAQSLRAADDLSSAFGVLRDSQCDNQQGQSQFSKENPTTPFTFMSARIEAIAGSQKEQSLMSRLLKQLHANTRAGRMGISGAVAVLAIGFFTLIPFSYEKTVGYEVAFAGVDKDLALNSDELHVMLEKLGLSGAEIDVTGCEETCNVKFSALNSSDDARLLVAVLSELENIELVGNIERVAFQTKGTLVEKAEDGLFFGVLVEEKSDGELHEVIIDCLGEDFAESCNVFIEKIHGVGVPEGSNFILNTDGGTLSGHGDLKLLHEDGSDMGVALIREFSGCATGGSDSSVRCVIVGGCDTSDSFDPSCCSSVGLNSFDTNGELTDEKLQELRDQGFEVTITELASGAKQVMLKGKGSGCVNHGGSTACGGSSGESASETGSDENESLAKELSTTLPEGYELSQNYPNPFNPTTKIDFSVAGSEHVTLEIVNLMGQRVRTLVDGTVGYGNHTVEWNATNDYGEKVSSGMYFYRLKVGVNVETKKMTLLK